MRKESITAIMPRVPTQSVDTLIVEMNNAEINTPLRQAAFIAQIAHESSELNHLEENLNYSAERLMIVFKKYFPSKEIADQYARQPEKIANRVYANRMGNGDEASGEGYKYHGRGVIQLTGKDNYKRCAIDIQQPLVEHPEMLLQMECAIRSATWFWIKNGLNELADKQSFVAITKRINGGTIGIEERQKYYVKALQTLNAEEG